MTFIGFGQNFVIAFAGSRLLSKISIFLADILAGEGLFNMYKSYRFFYTLLYPIFHLLYGLRPIHRERIPDGPLLVCANHSMLTDPLFISFSFGIGRHLRYMAKIELMRAPILGPILNSIGVFGVDRGKNDVNSIKTALRILKDGGIVGIFPEGTRKKEDNNEAKKGAIMLAAKTGAPILPVYIPRVKRLFTKVPVVIGEPYTVPKTDNGKEGYDIYAEELMNKISDLRKEVS
jgi:1-acyl-sn-glycerol-3-phosphate acyltransferase